MDVISKLVIPAAGWGTRFLPATKAIPKEMLPIVATPAIQLVVEEAANAGMEDVLLITARDKQAIENHFDRSADMEAFLAARGDDTLREVLINISQLARIHYVRQGEALGLGHAVLCARDHVGNEPFAVALPDDLIRSDDGCLSELLSVYKKYRCTILALQRVPKEKLSSFGVVSAHRLGEGLWEITDLVEKPPPEQAPSDLAVVGRYILEPEIFSALETTGPGVGGEIQLTDALRVLATKRRVIGWEFSGHRYDVGNHLGFIKATLEYALDSSLGPQLRDYLTELCEQLRFRRYD